MTETGRSASSRTVLLPGVPTEHERLQRIVQLCHTLANADRLEPMFDAVVDALAEGTGLQRTSVLTLDPTGAMRFRAFRGLSDTYRARVDGHSPWPPDCLEPAEILVDDVRTHPVTCDLAAVFAAEGIAALAFLPLVAGGRLLGKFMLYADRPTDWQRAELPFARAVADLLATFLSREATQQRLLQARKMESLGLLAGGIAHDFNNLMTAMMGHADMLRFEAPVGSPVRAQAEELLAVVGEASDLTRQLLDFARPRPLQTEAVDLVALVAEARQSLAHLAGEHVRLAVVQRAASLPIEANRAQLLQVLRNLVANARDAMPRGGHLTIAVGERTRPGGGRLAELAVTDDGIGMDDKVRARVFEPLFSTKRDGSSTGLGLSICYGIVSHLGGDIAVTSQPGCGSTFVVTLPVTTAQPQAARPVADAPTPRANGRPTTVLLVDDQTAVRRAMGSGMRSLGCDVVDVGSGDEALAALAQRRFDVVVSDVLMPGMDGVELVGHIHDLVPDQPVLLVTGYAERGACLPPHIPVLPKPFTPSELWQRLHSLVREPA